MQLPEYRNIYLPVVFAISLCVCVFSSFSTLPGLLHGDEAHYLVTTQSLLKDHDLNLKNNYDNRDYNEFMDGVISPHWAYLKNDVMYSSHEPGLPFMMTLFYTIDGRRGTVAAMSLISILSLLLVLPICNAMGIKPVAAALAVIATATTLPWLMMSGKQFPETPAALFLTAGFYLLMMKNTTVSHFWGTVMLAVLPWFHTKFTILSALLFLCYLYHQRPGVKKLVTVLLPPVTGAVFFLMFQSWIFGDPLYLVRVKGGAFQGPLPGVIGLLVDREAGLLTFAPVLFIGFIGLFRFKNTSDPLRYAGVVFIVFWLISGSWIDWHSGHCPPARYLIPFVPLLAVFMARELHSRRNSYFTPLFFLLWLVSLAQSVGVLVTIPEMAIVHYDGVNRLWAHFLPYHLDYLFPSWLNSGQGTNWLTAGVAGLGLMLVLCVYLRKPVRRYHFIVLIVFVVSICVVFAVGIQKEAKGIQIQQDTPLPETGPDILEPENNRVYYNTVPDIVWEPVPGADGYLWMIEMPDGSQVEVPKYGQTRQRLPDSILEAIPSGRYCWWIIPLKKKQRGVASQKVCFELIRDTSEN